MDTDVRRHVRVVKSGATVVRHHKRELGDGASRVTTTVERPVKYESENADNVWMWIENDESLYKEKQKLYDDYYNGRLTENEWTQGVNRLGIRALRMSDVKSKHLSTRDIHALRRTIFDDFMEYARYEGKKKGETVDSRKYLLDVERAGTKGEPVRDFKTWARKHPNFMTPDMISVRKRGEKYVEISEGTDFEHKPMYGVSVFKAKGDGGFEPQPESKSFSSRQEANEYADKVK